MDCTGEYYVSKRYFQTRLLLYNTALINDEHISAEKLYSEVEKILLKGQAKPQNAPSFFNERTEKTPNQDNVTDEKKNDTGMGNSNCTIV